MPMTCSKVFSGPVGAQLNTLEDATIVCNKVVVAASSHHRSPVSVTWKSQTGHGKQSRLLQRYVTVSQEVDLINFEIVHTWWKGNGGRPKMCIVVFWKVGGVLCVRVTGDQIRLQVSYNN